MSLTTATSYKVRLYPFIRFVQSHYKKTADELIGDVKAGRLDVYGLLGAYAAHLQGIRLKKNQSVKTMIERVMVIKWLLLFHDCEISDAKFRNKVKLPRKIRRDKEALDKDDVRSILLAIDDQMVKTYLLLLACTGMRATEAASIRLGDFDLKSIPPRVNIRGEFTKTKADRYVYLTQEFVKVFQDYLKFRYRERRVGYYKDNGKATSEKFSPQQRASDLIFASQYRDSSRVAKISSIYSDMIRRINQIMDRIGPEGGE